MSNGLNLLHPRKDVAEMVIVFCVSLIVPEDLMFAIKSGEHVYQESSFFVSWCNCSKMSEVLAGAHITMLSMFIPSIQGSLHYQPTQCSVIFGKSIKKCNKIVLFDCQKNGYPPGN